MHITIVTLFPEYFESPLSTALLGKAGTSGLVSFSMCNPRDFTADKHHSVDDRPYGGTPGMVMMLEPLSAALNKVGEQGGTGRIIMLSASGRPLTQSLARELSEEERLTLICGRYEGIDARLNDLFPIEEVCVGEAVLNGGEAAAMLLIEAACRLIPGFMGKEASADDESFSCGVLEHPHYTRPEVYRDLPVPEVLLSGNHANILRWRRERSLEKTYRVRPELLESAPLSTEDRKFLRGLAEKAPQLPALGRNLYCALVHYPVYLNERKTGATSLTNLDVHDIARCSCTYGLGGFIVVTPLEDQQTILSAIVRHWTEGPASISHPDRAEAFGKVRMASTVQDAIEYVESRTGQRPVLVGTSAQDNGESTPAEVGSMLESQPVLLLFGTGHGLAPEIFDQCSCTLRPLRWMSSYNHLPVRAAVAITLDRILGDRL